MRIVLLTCLLLLMVAACENDRPSDPQTNTAFRKEGTLEFVRPDGSVIRSIEIEIAKDEAARQTGLMNRRQMTLGQAGEQYDASTQHCAALSENGDSGRNPETYFSVSLLSPIDPALIHAYRTAHRPAPAYGCWV